MSGSRAVVVRGRGGLEVAEVDVRGLLRPGVDVFLPVERVREAHARLERNDVVGKIVLTF